MRADAMQSPVSSHSNRFGRAGLAVTALALAAALSGCSTPAKQSDTSSYLVLLSLNAASGADTSSTFGPTLASDVLTFGTAYSDPAEAKFQLAFKDPGTLPTPVNYITINRYHVRYIRTDGGAVPEPFDGAVSFTVTNAVTSSGSITLVRAQAKAVSPLVQLAGQGGLAFLPVSAEVTFDGTDQTGRAISVTGSVAINFADWADPGADTGAPVTTFTVSPDTGLKAGQVAQFDASASTVPSGRVINTYSWDFGDGSTATASGATTAHAFAAAGSYAVKLTVTDTAGKTYSVTRTITVVP
jgi:hypothetical protein